MIDWSIEDRMIDRSIDWLIDSVIVSRFCSTVVTRVTSDHLNAILTHVFTLILGNLGNPKATWMERIAAVVGQIVLNSRASLLGDRILPIASKLCDNTNRAHASEEVLRFGQRLGEDLSSVESEVGEQYAMLVCIWTEKKSALIKTAADQ